MYRTRRIRTDRDVADAHNIKCVKCNRQLSYSELTSFDSTHKQKFCADCRNHLI
jgi:hypothetical protein